MIFGLKGMQVQLVTLLNDDEATPIKMVGKKIVPILQTEDNRFMPESMDIVRHIDAHYGEPVLTGESGNHTLQTWLQDLQPTMYPLCMPRWVKAPLEEFKTQLSRNYFIKKKEAYIGPFAPHLKDSAKYIAHVNQLLERLAHMIESPEAVHATLSEDDIHLFAVLRALSIVKGLSYPAAVENYRQRMAEKSGVPLHDAIAF